MLRVSHQSRQLSTVILAAITVGCLASTNVPCAQSQTLNPGVFDPNTMPFGMSYGEWGAEWWKWALQFPADTNPIVDDTGEDGLRDNPGGRPVFFLAGNFGGTTGRTVAGVPDKPIFFPILNTINVATDPGETEQDIRDGVEASLATVSVLEATVDGVALQSEFEYRADSPAFTLNLTAGNLFGLAPGDYGPAVSGGYWLMLEPLGIGEHVVQFHGENPGDPGNPEDDFDLTVNYNLTVIPEPASVVLALMGLIGVVGYGCRFHRNNEESS